ncbi:MAG: serpin family protein [Peptostreptococcaceae bacterium]|nr:serpin family protein [Peptostreptococcaceae bacterium]
MKKILAGAAILSLLLSGCSPTDQPKKQAETPSQPSLIQAEQISKTTIAPSLDERSYEIFDALFQKQDKNKNFIVSPLSIQRTLDLIALCTDERNDFAALGIYDQNDLQKMDLSNSKMESLLLLSQDQFSDTPKIPFDNVKLTEFPESATKEKLALQERVLGEVLDKTPVKDESKFVFFDAIRYYSEWISPFDESQTFDRLFTTADGRQVMTPRMFREFDSSAYVDEEKEVFALYGKNDATVYFIKPLKDGQPDLSQAVKDHDEHALSAIVEFSMPKLEFRSDIDLSESFDMLDLGILNKEFRLEKLFPDLPLYLTSAKQNVMLRIDEKGAEAKAITSIDGNAIKAIKDRIEIHMDSPYYIVLTDLEKNSQQKVVTFIAYVADPTLKK